MAIPEPLEHVEADVPAILAVQVPGQSTCDPESISQAIGGAFGTLMAFLQRYALAPSGPPRAIYTSYGAEGTAFIVAMPIDAPPAAAPEPGPVTVGTIPAKRALRFTHRGPYRELMGTYNRITEFMQAKGMLASEADWARYMPMWEEYLNDPQVTPEADLLTYIYVPMS